MSWEPQEPVSSRHRARRALFAALFILAGPGSGAAASHPEKVDGYAEWRLGEALVVDGQRLRLAPRARFKGQGEAKSFASIPLGYEVKAAGTRAADGTLMVASIEAKPNGSALFESNVRSMTDAAEAEYRNKGYVAHALANGREEKVGELLTSGPEVQRVRHIVGGMVPPYLDRGDFRVYVVDNPEWNAFAMGNGSVFVYRGLLNDMDDDELAIVLGHELVHATHEHTRRQFKRQMWIQIAALGALGGEQTIDDDKKRAVAQLLTQLGAMAWQNGYGRDLEDQADRVGLRYAYQAGYDVRRGPGLWNRFARKYGQSDQATNFFFGDHSLAAARARHLGEEIERNYRDGGRDRPPERRRPDDR